jgi:hypothetical protein
MFHWRQSGFVNQHHAPAIRRQPAGQSAAYRPGPDDRNVKNFRIHHFPNVARKPGNARLAG